MGKMKFGIQIYLPRLNTVSIAKDGRTATVGGGTNAKNLTDALWAAGKQTGMFYLSHVAMNLNAYR